MSFLIPIFLKIWNKKSNSRHSPAAPTRQRRVLKKRTPQILRCSFLLLWLCHSRRGGRQAGFHSTCRMKPRRFWQNFRLIHRASTVPLPLRGEGKYCHSLQTEFLFVCYVSFYSIFAFCLKIFLSYFNRSDDLIGLSLLRCPKPSPRRGRGTTSGGG